MLPPFSTTDLLYSLIKLEYHPKCATLATMERKCVFSVFLLGKAHNAVLVSLFTTAYVADISHFICC